jgi:hypothetical protein
MPEMSDERWEPLVKRLREDYNPPPEVPREEMWTAIRFGMSQPATDVLSLRGARSRRLSLRRHPLAWASAAAAVLVLGFGIGRLTAPEAAVDEGLTVVRRSSVARAAKLEHLGRTESLLTMVRADARTGTVDPGMVKWARGLLAETRLLMDMPGADDPAVGELLEDLELVLVQIVGVAESEDDPARKRSELTLALEGLEERDVLARIKAVLPAGDGLAGT